MQKIRSIFKVDTNYDLLIVFAVYGITGTLSLFVSDYILDIFGLQNLIIRIVLLIFFYQILLIIIGTIFGQFKYFWEIEKRFLKIFYRKK